MDSFCGSDFYSYNTRILRYLRGEKKPENKGPYLLGLSICNGETKRSIRLRVLAIPFESHKQLEKFIMRMQNNRVNKRVYAIIWER